MKPHAEATARHGAGRWRGKTMLILLAALCGNLCLPAQAELAPRVIIHYIVRQAEPEPALSNLDPPPEDEGLKGAELGLSDNNTAGRFVGLTFELRQITIAPSADLAVKIKERSNPDTPHFIIVNAPAKDVLTISKLFTGGNAVILNAGSANIALRGSNCRSNVLHTLPSNDMLTDALVQFLVARRWTSAFLLSGIHPEDLAYAETFRQSAKKFGVSIIAEKTFDAQGADLRRSAGIELRALTQASSYDVVIVADVRDRFGAYLPYNTWLPRPVAGTHGLRPVAWARPIEAYGAAQLQERFFKFTGRSMTGIDYASWLAVRAVGEAALRLKTADIQAIQTALRGKNFDIAGFKGRALNFRSWNGQLRQPIHLVWPGSLVAIAPLEGFLHQRTELDTLGADKVESTCRNPLR